MTRPLDLINAEIQDAASELAEAVREQASITLSRADAIESYYRECYGDTPNPEAEKRHTTGAKNLQLRMEIARMKEQEYQIKLSRLGLERDNAKGENNG